MRLYRWSGSVRTSLFSWVPGSMPWQLGRVSIYGRVCLCLTPPSQCPAWTCESLTNSMQWSVAYKGMFGVIRRQCSVWNVGGSLPGSCVARFGEPRTLLEAELTRAKILELNLSTKPFDTKNSNQNYLWKLSEHQDVD